MNPPAPKPDFQSLYAQGLQCCESGLWSEAVHHFCAAIELQPQSYPCYHHMGLAMCQMGQFQAGIECFSQAIAIHPDNALPWLNRGNAHKELKQLDAACSDYLQAIALQADYAMAHFNLGNVYRQQMRLQEAAACFEAVLKVQPLRVDALSNLGVTYKELHQFDAALACFDKALQIDPANADVRWNKATALLMAGRYPEGWPLFESRWQLDAARQAAQAKHTATLWLGQTALQGRSLLISTEQGLGDTIQCMRYLPLLVAMGAQVTVEVQPALERLVRQFQGIHRVMVWGEERPCTDFYCPFMSLPLALKTDLATIPAPQGYVQAEPALQAAWAAQLANDPLPKLGLVWAGGDLFAANQRRNIPIGHFELLGDLSLSFYSLQKGEQARAELASVQATGWGGPQIIDHTATLGDLADTAGLISQLDAVVAVDTSVAHLAGAMGKPVYLLNRFDGCWRWLAQQSRSPWYDSLYVYNQPSPGDWESVLLAIKQDLCKLPKAGL